MSNYSNYDEVYRSVNKYMDYHTGEEYLEYCKPSEKIGTARLRGTLASHPNGKSKNPKRIGNRVTFGTAGYAKQYDTYFEFTETWVEKAEAWVRV